MKNLNKVVKDKFNNFFDWIKGAELVELKTCDVKEDPIRPELDVKFRTTYGRKIFGVKYRGEICAIMCFGYTNEVPKTIKDFDLIESKGVKVYVDPKASMFLIGSEMDYTKDKFASRFVFHNPNEKSTCGCGESFNI